MGRPLRDQDLNRESFDALYRSVAGDGMLPISRVAADEDSYLPEYWVMSVEPVPPTVVCVGMIATDDTTSVLVERITATGYGLKVEEGDKEYSSEIAGPEKPETFGLIKRDVKCRRVRRADRQRVFEHMTGIASLILDTEL